MSFEGPSILMNRLRRWVRRTDDSKTYAGESTDLDPFSLDGFLGPIDLFTQAQCNLILRHIRSEHPSPSPWYKGLAITDRFIYDLATRPALVDKLRLVLGNDVVLWGAIIIEKKVEEVHPWHVDIETSGDGRSVSVWIGLENTCRESSLKLISRSHRLGKTVQQVVHEHGLRRGQASDDDVLRWARKHDPKADLIQLDMKDGQAILFDGHLWHASQNLRQEGSRTALLLQYAVSEKKLFAPDFDYLEWPFRFTDKPVPRLLISGHSNDTNALVSAPAADPDIGALNVFAETFPLPFAEDLETRWRPHTFFRGSTPNVELMNCHISVLSVGHSPHLPHIHVEEELLVVLDGVADIVLNDRPVLEGAQIKRLQPGSFVFHPAYQHHTIQNSAEGPVTYIMFKWRAAAAEINQPLDSQFFDIGDLLSVSEGEPFKMRCLFEDPTAYLGKLHSHVSILQPGAGYEAHHDEHDVAIVLLSGKVETVDRVVEPLGVIFYAAGEMHGMKNAGEIPARYLVFEFHAPKAEQLSSAEGRRV